MSERDGVGTLRGDAEMYMFVFTLLAIASVGLMYVTKQWQSFPSRTYWNVFGFVLMMLSAIQAWRYNRKVRMYSNYESETRRRAKCNGE